METKYYTTISSRIARLGGRFMVMLIIVSTPFGAINILDESSNLLSGLRELILFLGAMMLGVFLILFVVNMIPTVGVTSSGITLEGVWANYQLSWGDIELIHPSRIAISKMWFVGSRKLTVLHHAAGLIYARKNIPGFFVYNKPRNDELIQIIKDNITKAPN